MADQEPKSDPAENRQDETTARAPLYHNNNDRTGFRRIKDASRMVSELRDGDGIDPRIEQRQRQRQRDRSGPKPDYATARLASQISRCINANLGGDLLADFEVQSVVPGKGNNFVVTLKAINPNLSYDPHLILQAAIAMVPQFRAEIAQAINRKKVPNLSMRIAPSSHNQAKDLS